jgi:AcrR family transcriptional regulator
VREAIREETEARLVAAGEEVFSEQGVQAARVEDIAERAGVAVGTLYNYFGDREGLLSAIAKIRRAELVEMLDESLEASARLPWQEQLAHFLRTTERHFDERRRFYSLALQSDVPTTRKNCERAAALRDFLQRAETLVRRGVKEGLLDRKNHDLYSVFLVGMLRATMLHAMSEDREGSMAKLIDPMVAFFLNGATSR